MSQKVIPKKHPQISQALKRDRFGHFGRPKKHPEISEALKRHKFLDTITHGGQKVESSRKYEHKKGVVF